MEVWQTKELFIYGFRQKLPSINKGDRKEKTDFNGITDSPEHLGLNLQKGA